MPSISVMCLLSFPFDKAGIVSVTSSHSKDKVMLKYERSENHMQGVSVRTRRAAQVAAMRSGLVLVRFLCSS